MIPPKDLMKNYTFGIIFFLDINTATTCAAAVFACNSEYYLTNSSIVIIGIPNCFALMVLLD